MAREWQQKPDLVALQGRVKLVGGDFFRAESIPTGQEGDLYFMRNILHDCESKNLPFAAPLIVAPIIQT